MTQQELQARYLQSLYQTPPPNAMLQPQEEERSANPFFVCLMWLLVGVGLMFFAFQMGVLDRLFRGSKQKNSPKEEDSTTVPATLYYEVVEGEEEEEGEDYMIDLSGMPSLEESQEREVDRRFSTVAEKYGLLDKAQQNGRSFGTAPDQEGVTE